MKYDRKTVFWQTKGLCLHDYIVQRNWKSSGDEAAQPAISPQPWALVWRQTHLLREKNNSCMANTSIIKHERRRWCSPSGWAHVPGSPLGLCGKAVGEVSEAQSRFHEVTLRLTNIGKLISKDGSSISATRYWLTSFLWKGNEIKKGNKWIRNLHSHSDNKQLESGFILLTYSTGQGVCFCFSSKHFRYIPPVETATGQSSSQRHRIYTKTSAIKQTEGNLHEKPKG